jgi:hypothetical protein
MSNEPELERRRTAKSRHPTQSPKGAFRCALAIRNRGSFAAGLDASIRHSSGRPNAVVEIQEVFWAVNQSSMYALRD